jgi:hypothetical protein
MTTADIVLQLVRQELNWMMEDGPFRDCMEFDSVAIKAWRNGRENGYALCCHLKGAEDDPGQQCWIAWTEHRIDNAAIVIYRDYEHYDLLNLQEENIKSAVTADGERRYRDAAEEIAQFIAQMKAIQVEKYENALVGKEDNES